MAIVIAMVMVIGTNGSTGVDAQAGTAVGDYGVKLERWQAFVGGTAHANAAARRATVDGAQMGYSGWRLGLQPEVAAPPALSLK